MASLTIDQMGVLVAERLQDVSNNRWTSAQIFRFLNEAQRDFARGSKIVRKKSSALAVSATTPAYSFYTLPSDFLEIEPSGVWTTYGGQTIPLEGVTAHALGANWDNITGDPPTFYVSPLEFGMTELRVYPTPTATLTGLFLYYSALPADLTTGQTTPIPPIYHMALVYNATAQCFALPGQGQDLAQAGDYMGRYERELEDAVKRVGRRFTGKAPVVRWSKV